MFHYFKKTKAAATIEYVMLIMMVLGAFVVFKKYFERALYSRWKGASDTFAHGRRYYPGKTKRCTFDYVYFNVWYDTDCFEANCDCASVTKTKASCQDCISVRCTRPYCDD